VTGGLTALRKIICNVHCGCLILDRAPNLRLKMRYLALDIQTFGVCIEDKGATIRMSDLWAFYLTTQLPF
jgi:hypothetical protein